MDPACVELFGIDFRRLARVKCSPKTSSTSNGAGDDRNYVREGVGA